MKKIVTIVGARPQFIKAAVISRLIRNEYSERITEFLVHTGQHYDQNMSDIFFKEMMIPEPDINLNVGSGTHGKMTGEMLIKIEEVLIKQNPDIVLVYGDTNSTLAGALAASKRHIPVAHVEAGLRSFNMTMPEEQNRILTDHISTYLFCPTENSVKNLQREGIEKGVFNVGDVMYDANLFYRNIIEKLKNKKSIFKEKKLPGDYFLLTIHRAENTDIISNLKSIIAALNDSNKNVIFPVHPRTNKLIKKYNLKLNENIYCINPVGYYEMLELEKNCNFIITDSGGVQKEAYFFNKPCITLRNETEWVETIEQGVNFLAGSNKEKILSYIKKIKKPRNLLNLYGDGNSGYKILERLLNKI